MTVGPTVEHQPEAILGRMEHELESCGPLGRERWPQLRAEAARIRAPEQPIIVTGCGDSYYAGLAMRYALEEACGRPVIAMPAMDTATLPQNFAQGAVMVGVSVSGKVGRTIEAVQRHADAGGTTIAVTAYADSDLGMAADQTITTELRGTPGPVPGTVNYLGSLLALAALANRLAGATGAFITDAQVGAALQLVESVTAPGSGPHDEVVDELSGPLFALGSGPDFGIASFGVAKLLEAASSIAVAQDLEEWAHEQFFATGPGSTVVVHATRPEVADRAASVAEMARRVGGRTVIVSNQPLAHVGDIAWDLSPVEPRIAPLAAWAPLAMTALTYARVRRRWPFGLDREERMVTVDSNIYVAQPRRS